jgi:hypothetical protein
MHFQKQSFGLEKTHPGQLWTFDHHDRNLIVTTYPLMQKAGFLRDLPRSPRILPLLGNNKAGQGDEGDVQFAACLPFREIRCRGWSIGGGPEAGNRVLIVMISPGNGKVLAVADGPVDQRGPDVSKMKQVPASKLAAFDLRFDIPRIEPGIYRLVAFRYGKDERSYYPIGAPGELAITP